MAQYPELETPLVQTSIGELEEPVEKSNSPKKTNSPSGSPVKKVQNATAAAVEGRCISPNKLA